MNIVLIGARGSGKSSVAEAVARKLGRELVCLDDEITHRAGVPISELVAENGWDAFRDLETAVVNDVTTDGGRVIDTGGGAVTRPENVAAMKRTGQIIWLRAGLETIKARIGDATDRPSLTGTKTFLEEMEDILAQRTPIYTEAADHVVDTDGRTIEDIATEIVEYVTRQA